MEDAYFCTAKTSPLLSSPLLLEASVADALTATAQAARAFLATAVFGAILAVACKGQSPNPFFMQDSDRLWFALLSHQFISHALPNSATVKAKDDDEKIKKTRKVQKAYNWALSTQENHRSNENRDYGKYAAIRKNIDKSFHGYYTEERQLFQDKIIDGILAENRSHCSLSSTPWIVFTAGAMGAGKTHTVRLLDERGRFPLGNFVSVDPDVVRHQLPEFSGYTARTPGKAGELTRNECGMISEILTRAALLNGQNVLVDGSLRNASWYMSHFQDLRNLQPNLRIAILHITAPREAVFERAASRAKVTGRVVPLDLLEATMTEVPQSVETLKFCVEYTAEIRNDPHADDVELVSGGDWRSFRQAWNTTCGQ